MLVGPQKEGQFPETKEGIAVRTLPARQKKPVRIHARAIGAPTAVGDHEQFFRNDTHELPPAASPRAA